MEIAQWIHKSQAREMNLKLQVCFFFFKKSRPNILVVLEPTHNSKQVSVFNLFIVYDREMSVKMSVCSTSFEAVLTLSQSWTVLQKQNAALLKSAVNWRADFCVCRPVPF